MFAPRTNTEKAVLAAFEYLYGEAYPNGRERWIELHGSVLAHVIDREYRRLFPGRRNRPAYLHVAGALRRMVREGFLEEKRVADGPLRGQTLYRKCAVSK